MSGWDGFVMHFIPSPPTGAANIPRLANVNDTHYTQNNSKVTFTFQHTTVHAEISIFNVSGKLVTHFSKKRGTTNSNSLVWNASKLARGVYFYKVKSGVLRAGGN